MRTLLFATTIALAALGCTESSKETKAEVKHDLPVMSVDDVAAGLEAKQLTVVDCNGAKTRKKHGILPGAILLEDEETFPTSALPTDKMTKLVFYCGGPG
ncbi:MAG: hypothetical protein H0T89_29295 [Deltaproteobacteria bacterium]|nr:hypothetical protein [Deltaproteobacteria bacterium]MDQ3297220.1 hypothetical protein [Myxococcota bacterium]